MAGTSGLGNVLVSPAFSMEDYATIIDGSAPVRASQQTTPTGGSTLSRGKSSVNLMSRCDVETSGSSEHEEPSGEEEAKEEEPQPVLKRPAAKTRGRKSQKEEDADLTVLGRCKGNDDDDDAEQGADEAPKRPKRSKKDKESKRGKVKEAEKEPHKKKRRHGKRHDGGASESASSDDGLEEALDRAAQVEQEVNIQAEVIQSSQEFAPSPGDLGPQESQELGEEPDLSTAPACLVDIGLVDEARCMFHSRVLGQRLKTSRRWQEVVSTEIWNEMKAWPCP